jgi:hypothetical protein
MKARHLHSQVIVRAVVIGLLLSLLLTSAILAYRSPAANMISNPAFEIGPGHFSPWARAGDTRLIIGDESCCGQHETFFWPDGAAHGWSSLYQTPRDTWDGFVWNQNQAGTLYGAVFQGSTNFVSAPIAGQRYRLSAWMATSNGNTANLKWYANGVTNNCASTTGVWPGNHVIWPTSQTSPQTSLNVSCEFTPNNVTGFNVQMPVNVSSGQWVVSDDWLLTPLVTVPLIPNWPRLPVPVKYWARDYGSTVDRAANSWNTATGRSLFVKASSEADANLIIDGINNFCDGTPGGDNGLYGVTYPIGYSQGNCFIASGKQLVEVNMWYFSRWSGDPKQSTVAHELGHVLGLDHVDTCQLMRSYADVRYWYCGVVAPTTKDASSVP